MNSHSLSGRLARLEQRVDPDKQLRVVNQVSFVALVDVDDPRCGTWNICLQGKTATSSFTDDRILWPRPCSYQGASR